MKDINTSPLPVRWVHYCPHFTGEQTEAVEERVQGWHSLIPHPLLPYLWQSAHCLPLSPHWASESYSTQHSRLP